MRGLNACRESESLCVFGPGGEFRTEWPPGSASRVAKHPRAATVAVSRFLSISSRAPAFGLALERIVKILPLVAIGPLALRDIQEAWHAKNTEERTPTSFDAQTIADSHVYPRLPTGEDPEATAEKEHWRSPVPQVHPNPQETGLNFS